MDAWKVADILHTEFGNKGFRIRDINDGAMQQLTELMGITETDAHRRSTRVGKAIGSLEGETFALPGKYAVKVEVVRPAKPDKPLRYRLAPSSSVD